jgi:hypothetical protein
VHAPGPTDLNMTNKRVALVAAIIGDEGILTASFAEHLAKRIVAGLEDESEQLIVRIVAALGRHPRDHSRPTDMPAPVSDDSPALLLGTRALWTIDDVMRTLRCSRSAVYDLAAAGQLDLVKVRRASRITDGSLRQYYEQLLDTKPKLRRRRERAGD